MTTPAYAEGWDKADGLVHHLKCPHFWRHGNGMTEAQYMDYLLEDAKSHIETLGSENVACFIAEPIYLLGLFVFINNYIEGNVFPIALIYMFSSVVSIFVFTAPAGFGIREYLFIVICDYLNFESNENLLLVILSFRLLIICSDLIIYLSSFLYKASLKNKQL